MSNLKELFDKAKTLKKLEQPIKCVATPMFDLEVFYPTNKFRLYDEGIAIQSDEECLRLDAARALRLLQHLKDIFEQLGIPEDYDVCDMVEDGKYRKVTESQQCTKYNLEYTPKGENGVPVEESLLIFKEDWDNKNADWIPLETPIDIGDDDGTKIHGTIVLSLKERERLIKEGYTKIVIKGKPEKTKSGDYIIKASFAKELSKESIFLGFECDNPEVMTSMNVHLVGPKDRIKIQDFDGERMRIQANLNMEQDGDTMKVLRGLFNHSEK